MWALPWTRRCIRDCCILLIFDLLLSLLEASLPLLFVHVLFVRLFPDNKLSISHHPTTSTALTQSKLTCSSLLGVFIRELLGWSTATSFYRWLRSQDLNE